MKEKKVKKKTKKKVIPVIVIIFIIIILAIIGWLIFNKNNDNNEQLMGDYKYEPVNSDITAQLDENLTQEREYSHYRYKVKSGTYEMSEDGSIQYSLNVEIVNIGETMQEEERVEIVIKDKLNEEMAKTEGVIANLEKDGTTQIVVYSSNDLIRANSVEIMEIQE